MSITHILADLRQRNITVRVREDGLSVIADKGALSPDVKAILVAHKQEIVRYLQQLEEGVTAEIAAVANRTSRLPLSFGQQRLWFLAQLEPDSSAYLIPGAVTIEGPLEPVSLAHSLDQVIQRHEVLRTIFVTEDGQPSQVILPEMHMTLPLVDLRKNSKETLENAIAQRVSQEMSTRFDLASGPLLRGVLLQLDEQKHILLLTLHHIVADGWSIAILIRELSAFYTAFQTGRPAELLPLSVQYADYAVWQQKWKESAARERQLSYWRTQLGNLAPLTLPADRPRQESHVPRGASSPFVIPGELAGRLRSLGLQQEATVFMVFLGAFQALLSRYSAQQQIAVGTPVANRERKEIEGLIGFFVNTLVLCLNTEGTPSFRQLLSQIRKTTLEAFDNQDLPFEQLVDELQPARNLNRNPLFQVMFILQNTPRAELRLGEIRLQPFNVENPTAKFDLTLSLSEDGGELQGWLSYNAELFEPASVSRMIGHYCVLLRGIVEQPNQPVAELPLLMEAERRQLLKWNQTATDYPGKFVDELFEEHAAKTPDAVAVDFEGQQLTYEELNRRANQLGRYLKKLGAGAETRVGICMERSVEMVTGLLAILKAGAAYMPLDPDYPADRLCFMLEEAKVPVILIQEKLAASFPERTAKLVKVDREWESISRESTANLHVPIDPENLVYVIYTSGSTGRPKGAMNSHRGLRNRILWMQEKYRLSADDRVLQKTPYSFDVSVWEFFWPLITGAGLVVAQPGGHRDPQYLGELIRQKKVSTLHFVPSMLAAFLDAGAARNCGSVRRVICSGEALGPELARRCMEEMSAELHNLYGPTEASIDVTYYQCEPEGIKNGVSIGKPIANTGIHILDNLGNPVPMLVTGELYIGGAGLARGYVNRPDLTADRFVPDHVTGRTGERLYRTGDKARWRADGNVEYLGRLDSQVKIRGYRIELGEIEAVLMRHHAVEQTAVVVREDQHGEKRLTAYVVLDEPENASPSALREFMGTCLPEYMVPAMIVELRELPLSANGKLDRKALPQPEYPREQAPVAPRNAEEEILCQIFAEVLQLDQVGAGQNFFAAGGHSLLATQVISRVRNAFGVDLPLRVLFEAPTVTALAQRVEHARGVGQQIALPLVRLARDQAVPLSFAQQRLWFLDQFVPNSPTYNINIALRLQGELRLEVLEWALNEVVRRHEVLRTRMEVVEGQARQIIASNAAVSIAVTDMSQLEPGDREAVIARWIREEAETPFNLAHGPLLRIKLLQRQEQDHVLLLTMHHIVSDAWSMGIMVREFSHFYEAKLLGRESPLPELPIQYADYAVWQRNWIQGEMLERQIAYWRTQLAEPPVLEMPTDYAREASKSETGASAKWVLSEELSRNLKDLSRREGVTLFMTLLTAFQLLLSRCSGQNDISIGSPIAGRTRTELEGLIGFFVNTLVLRSDLSGSPTFRELLARIRETTLTAYAHQDVPFEKLVEELQPRRDLSRSPLFQAMFVLQNAPMVELELPGLKLSLMERVAETVHFELLLTAAEENGRIAGGLSYRTALFAERSIHRLLAQWQRLLASITANPQSRIGELEMLPEVERRQVVEEWNSTDAQYRHVCVHQMFEQQAASTPAAEAVEYAGQQLSYAELNRRANQLAHYLRRLGAGPDVLVGICVERGLEMAIGVLAILKTGSAYVPLDPKYPASRLSYMLEISRIDLLLTEEQFQSTFAGLVRSTISVDRDWQTISKETQTNLNAVIDAENLAYVIYTSGSTGQPKGVAMRHGSLANLIHWQLRQSSNALGSRTLQFASLSFDVSFQELFATWCAGGCLLLIEEHARRDPMELWQLVCDHRVARLFLPFVALQQLAETALRASQKPDYLREMITAGEQLKTTPALQKLFAKLPMCVLENQYGPSESHVVTAYRLGGETEKWAPLPPIGKPIANTQVYLLNSDYLAVPVGVTGELYLGGAQLARGYINRPELTAERFVPNPFSKEPGERLYKTGDRARYLENGDIEYLGRMDQQVKVRGYRIELAEVESALSECDGVAQAAVVVHEDETGEKRLAGYVVIQNGHELDEAKLRNDLKQRLPEYMAPSVLVVLEQLPLTPSGKVDRKRLPKPGRAAGVRGEDYVAARNVTEEILCGIWEELLKRKRISVTQNFFEAGGHSLLATQVIARVRDALQVELPVRRIFEAPTVAELARVIESLTANDATEKIIPIVRAPRDQAIPLSFAQQRLWFLDQLQRGTATYNIPLALRLSGILRIDLMEQVFTELITRHETLRTSFSIEEGQPVQMIAPAGTISLPIIDLSELPEDMRETEAMHLAEEEARLPFDLGQGPLLRLKLLRIAAQEHGLLVTMHHIIGDAWSIGIMVQEFSRLYEAACRQEAQCLPELPIQYADFSVWQRKWLQGAVLEKQLQYWKQQLVGVQPLDLPSDRPRPAVMSHAGASVEFSIEAEDLERLKRLSWRQGTTLYMTLLAAFQALLHRYSGQSDISVGSPIAGRRSIETEGLIGLFVNTLVMRTGLSGELSFTELLRRVRGITLEAYAHQDVPFEKVVEALQPERDLGRTPLFQVMFSVQNAPRAELQIGELKLRPFSVNEQTAKFDLAVTLSEDGERGQGWAAYNTQLFDAATVTRMIQHYCVLLSGIAEQPEQSLAELPLLTPVERRHLLVEWNQTARQYPQTLIHELFEQQAMKTPTAIAVECGNRQLSYLELNERANQLAWYLRKLGVGAEVRVGICMERSLEMVVGLLGILKAGGAYVPLDPNYPPERLAYMLEDSFSPVLLTEQKLLSRLPSYSRHILILDVQKDEVGCESCGNLASILHSENLAYVIYTSGSTGKPKGVSISHGSAAVFVNWAHELFPSQDLDGVLASTSICFDLSVFELFVPLAYGGRVVVVNNILDLPTLTRPEKVKLINTVPSAMRELVRMKAVPESVHTVNLAGEALAKPLVEEIYQLGTVQRVFNLYGPSEDTTYSTYALTSLGSARLSASIGKPVSNSQAYVLDPLMNLVPAGVAGELYLGGAGLARGYLNRPELTAEKFIPNPFASSAGERLYRTGDLVKWRGEGDLEYLGRMDHQVKLRGFRIELGEIEAMLLQQKEIEGAAVIVREDEPGEKRLVAYIVAPGETTASELRDRLKEKLPDYMVPAAFLWLNALPLTPNGKIDRGALSRALPETQKAGRAYAAPRTSAEEVLAQIWAELLKVERIGIHDNFFELGGHSLLAFRLMTIIKNRLDRDLPLASLFQDPTIVGLAKFLEKPVETPSSSILVPIQAKGSREPFFCMHPVGGQVICYAGLARELGTDQPIYALQSPNHSQSPVGTIEEMACLYIREIRRIQPCGPYRLGGWSMGGLLAFEMAHQLIEQGEKIGLLALIDSIPPAGFSGKHNSNGGSSMLERFAWDMGRMVLNNPEELREQFLRAQPQQRMNLLLNVLVREEVVPQGSGESELNRLLEIFTRNSLAMDRYELRAINQRIVFFPASGEEGPEQLGTTWKKFTTAGVDVHPVSGDHYSILKPPYLSEIVVHLLNYLDPVRLAAVSG
jgi:amino acid adenylation domain-containing protein